MPQYFNEPCGSLGQKESKYADKQPTEDAGDNLLCASTGKNGRGRSGWTISGVIGGLKGRSFLNGLY